MFSPKSLLFALTFSIFIYFEWIGFNITFINSIAALFSLYLLLTLNKKELFFGGFYSGILWFWWLGYSFIYYDLLYLVPFVVVGIGLVYGILFYLGGVFNHLLYKVSYFFILSFINVFGFNWFKLELPFIESFFGTSKIEYLLLLFTTALFVFLIQKGRFKQGMVLYTFGLTALFIFNFNMIKKIDPPDIDIVMNSTDVAQDIKWLKEIKRENIEEYLKNIDTAIVKKKDLIIFPETAFAVVMNKNKYLQDLLIERSKRVSVILGALYQKDGLYYNSTYLFNKGKMEVAHKVVLVPFGEAVPLPQKIRDWINNTFYNGAKDYEVAKQPTTFNIKGEKFRSAICYEATTDEIYKDLDTNYVVAISNNGWFVPSHQPSLQKLLLKYYAKKYDLMIYSVTNKSGNEIIY